MDDEYAAHLQAAADRWRAFPLDVFSDDGLGPDLGPERGHALGAARITAGAIMSATETLLDQLFDDLIQLADGAGR
ncbi:MAG: hypothetical protein JWP11_3401 [Frankiales bacterium]|nr:hypothetical protein [Frankiales bacterium]